MKFGEKLHKILYIQILRKNQIAVTFRDNGIKVLRYIYLETVSHLVQHLLILQKKLAKQKFFVLRQ